MTTSSISSDLPKEGPLRPEAPAPANQSSPAADSPLAKEVLPKVPNVAIENKNVFQPGAISKALASLLAANPNITSVEIGRSRVKENPRITVDNEEISRTHVHVVFDATRKVFTVTDAGSQNGTYVRDDPLQDFQRLAPNTPRDVTHQSEIRLGGERAPRFRVPNRNQDGVISVDSEVAREGRQGYVDLFPEDGREPGRLGRRIECELPRVGSSIKIGRSPNIKVGSNASISHVSATHLEITRTDSGFRYQDLGSSQGTWLTLDSGKHSVRMAPNVPYDVESASKVFLAGGDFAVRLNEVEREVEATVVNKGGRETQAGDRTTNLLYILTRFSSAIYVGKAFHVEDPKSKGEYRRNDLILQESDVKDLHAIITVGRASLINWSDAWKIEVMKGASPIRVRSKDTDKETITKPGKTGTAFPGDTLIIGSIETKLPELPKP